MPDKVLRENEGGLAILTLNRPEKLNSLTVELFEDLLAHVEAIERETGSVGCVILRGAGKCFSAGHDLRDIKEGERPPRPNFQAEVIERLATLPQTVISAVHGHCYTGALELALAGDIIVAAASAKFADTHAKWGLTPVWGLSQRLPRRVGRARALEMMLACRTYSGAEAVAMGLANSCFDDDAFDRVVKELAAEILENSWFSHRVNKSLIDNSDGMSLQAGLAYEISRSPGFGPDAADRVAAFMERKK